MFQNIFMLSIVTLLSVPTTPSYAQSTSQADIMIVEGTRLPTPATETGSSITIITGDEIEARGYAFLLDAVASAPGVTINQNGSFGGAATVRVRGASTGQTLVLLDGVPLGDPTGIDGGYDFSIFDSVDIDRVEVLKGPQSTLWGSDAIGGVINIVTRKSEPGLTGKLFAEGGSFGTFRGGATFTAGGEKGNIRFGVSSITTDGISKADEDDGNTEEDGYDGLTVSSGGAWEFTDDLRIEGAVRQMTGEVEIDGFTFTASGFSLGDTEDRSETEQLTGHISLNADMLGDRLTHTMFAGYTDIERNGNFGGFAQNDTGDRRVLRYQGILNLTEKNRFAFGVEREESETQSGGTPLGKTDIVGLFALYEAKPHERVTLTGGLRNDDHSDFGSTTTARIAASWAVNDLTVLRSSWGEGFKAPTIFQLTQSFGALPPNGDLQPETSDAFDLGIDYSDDDRSFSMTVFSRDTENEIIFDPDFRYSNLEATKAEGLEFAAEARVSKSFSVAGNYAFIDAEDRTTGERQIRIPRHSGDLALTYNHYGSFSGSLIVRHNGEESEGAFGTDVAAWTRVDLAASYLVTKRAELYGRIENLFDEDYQQVSGFGTPGTSAYTGIKLSL